MGAAVLSEPAPQELPQLQQQPAERVAALMGDLLSLLQVG